MVVVIIPAGGIGKRLGLSIPKQFIKIEGKPIIAHTLSVFEKTSVIDKIIIPVVREWQTYLQEIIISFGFKKIHAIVPGGKTRQDSVYAGLKALPQKTSIVLVHDAARPFVTQKTIEEVIKMIKLKGAAIAATPVKDTVKDVKDGLIRGTIPRERIFLAQTPQGAQKDLLLYAFEKAYMDGFIGTDEASILERAGIPVWVVPSPSTNFKITTIEDLRLAEAFFIRRYNNSLVSVDRNRS